MDGESIAIEEMQPPINLLGNAAHPFYEQMRDARALFQAVAKGAT